jgi:hypothetical protein
VSFKDYLKEDRLKAPGIHDTLVDWGFQWFSDKDGLKAKYTPVINRFPVNRLADLLTKNGYRFCGESAGTKSFKKKSAWIDHTLNAKVNSGNVQNIDYHVSSGMAM